MKKYRPVILLLAVVTAFSSCKKEEEEEDTPKSTIVSQNLTVNGSAKTYEALTFGGGEATTAGSPAGYYSYELVLYNSPIVGNNDGTGNSFTGVGEFIRLRFEDDSFTDYSSTRDLTTAGVSGTFEWIGCRLGANGNPFSFDGSQRMTSGTIQIAVSGDNVTFTFNNLMGEDNGTISGTLTVTGHIEEV